MPRFQAMVRAALFGKGKGLPLRNPIGAFPLAIGLQLLFHVVQFGFIPVGAVVELKLRKALFQDGLNVIDAMGFQEIEDHGIGDEKLAVDRFRVVRESVGNGAEVDIRRRRDHDEAHVIFPPPPAAAGELLDFIDGEFRDVAILANA